MYAKGRGYIHQDILKELLELVEQPMPEDEIKDIIETMCKGKGIHFKNKFMFQEEREREREREREYVCIFCSSIV